MIFFPDLSICESQQALGKIFEGPGLSAPPWPDNPAWDFTVFPCLVVFKLIHCVKFARSYYMIFEILFQ
jgi:hypothetical protein